MAIDFVQVLAVLLNMVLCVGGLIMCICRGRFINPRTTKREIRLLYRAEAFAFFAVLLSPLYAGPVSAAQLILLAANVFRLWYGRGAWLFGQPAYATSSARS
jgi:hypothetical protein